MKVINLKDFGVVVINSSLTKEAIEKLKRHTPTALKLMDEEKNEIFGVTFGTASISDYGISFDRVDSEGKVLITINASLENNEIADQFAKVLTNLKKVEEKALAAYTELEAMLLDVANSIENPLVPEMAETQDGGAE